MRSSPQVAVPTVLLLGSPNSVKLKSVEDRVIPSISTTQVQSPKPKEAITGEKSSHQLAATSEISQQKLEDKNSNNGADSSTSSSTGTPFGTPGTSGNNTPVGSPNAASIFASARPASATPKLSAESVGDGQDSGQISARRSFIGERQNSGWNFSSRGRQDRPAELQIGAKTRGTGSDNVVADNSPAVDPITAPEPQQQKPTEQPINEEQQHERVNEVNPIKTMADVAQLEISTKHSAAQGVDSAVEIVPPGSNEVSVATQDKPIGSNYNRNSLNLDREFTSPFDDFNPMEETIVMPSTRHYDDTPNPMEETIIMPSTVDGAAQLQGHNVAGDHVSSPQLQPRYSVSFNTRKSVNQGTAPRITMIGANRNRGDSGDGGSPSDSPKQRSAAKTHSSDCKYQGLLAYFGIFFYF